MARRSITQLPLPSPTYLVDLFAAAADGPYVFESLAKAIEEAEFRSASLMAVAWKAPLSDHARECWQLSCALMDHVNAGEPCRSLACPLCMREQRIRFTGALWELAEDSQWGEPVTATLIGRRMQYEGGSLHRASAKKLKKALLADLDRCGAGEANGYVVAVLHGEFEPNRKVFQYHWHLLVAGDMIAVVDRLRERPKYRSRKGDKDGVWQRVRIGRKPLEHLPAPLTYLLQSWWPCRWIGDVGNGEIKRQRQRHRIPEPFHSEYLLWLREQRLEDMILLRKLDVTKHGLRVTSQH